jgi:hypothetical protein
LGLSFGLTALVLAPALLSGAFDSCVQSLPPMRAQLEPGAVAGAADAFWRGTTLSIFERTRVRREELRARIHAEVAKIAAPVDFDETDESQTVTAGTYGQLPEVLVDTRHGAIFPMAISGPHRFSWFQAARDSWRMRGLVRQLEAAVAALEAAPQAAKPAQVSAANALWNSLHSHVVLISQRLRYLEAWVPNLRVSDGGAAKNVRAMLDPQLTHAHWERLRDALRPLRILNRPYMPKVLKRGRIELPIVTDVRDTRLIAELEGALDTHWNQSPWARERGVTFRIRWKKTRANAAFAEGRENLAKHLARFPKTTAVLTTGGLTTYVSGNALVLGPGRLQPRTLAHELGHLMGFGDCYLRTLSSQGIFGYGVLEWDNPLYPDDLMCDNLVGVPRVEVW